MEIEEISSRKILATYQDPLDIVWLWAAKQVGIEVRRSDSVFASWNGNGILTVGTPETLDPDDTLAQMIFHEMCHSLVEGPAGWNQEDWGLGNDAKHEHACLRLQASLADEHGLRGFFAATTDFRAYFDRLPTDPLSPSTDASEAEIQVVKMAANGRIRVVGKWQTTLERALATTASIRGLICDVAPKDSIWTQ